MSASRETDDGPLASQRTEATARRLPLASPATAAVVGVVALVAPFGAIPLAILIHQTSFQASSSIATYLVFGLAFAAVGLVVARREPGNPVGWLLLGASLTTTLGSVCPAYAYLDYSIHHGRLPLGPVAVLLGQAWIYTFMLLPLIILLFPEGRLGSRWRWPVRFYLLLIVVYIAGTFAVAIAALRLRLPVDNQGNIIGAGHPSGTVAWVGPVQNAITVLFAISCVAAVVHQIVAFRRSGGERRQQLKWLGAGAAIAVVVLLGTIIWTNGPGFVGNVLLPIAMSALPASIGVGILRYRLYEIDRLVSRTLSYAILSALLIGTFIGLVALTTNTLALSGRVGVAASTLAAAALFNPLRRRIQHLVDRRFNRARYDAEATVAAFTARLRDAVELDAVRTDLLDAVNRAVQPTHASVWIKP